MDQNHNFPTQSSLFALAPKMRGHDRNLSEHEDDREGLHEMTEDSPAKLVEILPRFTHEHGEFHFVAGRRIHISCGTPVPSGIICPQCYDVDDDEHCICGRESPNGETCTHCSDLEKSGH